MAKPPAQPLDQNQQIVDPRTGNATLYFLKWAQQRMEGISAGITKAEAEALIIAFMEEHPLTAGLGITLTPSGNIADDITIAVQLALGQLTDVDTTTTPPTDGQALIWNDADSLWVPGDVASGGGGGGGSLQQLQKITAVGGETSFTFNVPADYDDIIIVINGRSTRASNDDQLRMRFNGDTGNNYAWQTDFLGTAFVGFQGTAQSYMELPQMTGATATANRTTSMEIVIPAYKNTTFNKAVFAQSSEWESNQRGQTSAGVWYSNAAVSSITILMGTGAFVAGSTIVIYGRGPTPKVWPGNVIFEYTCVGGETFVDIPNIPQTFRDLILVGNGRTSFAGTLENVFVQANGDTGANYRRERNSAEGSASSQAGANDTGIYAGQFVGATGGANLAATFTTEIYNYSRSVFFKGWSSTNQTVYNASTGNYRGAQHYGAWANTAPITSLRVIPQTATTFVAGTTITLYGRGGPGGQTIYARPWYWKPPVASSFSLSSGDATQLTLGDDPDVGLTFTTPPATTNIIRMFYRTLTNKALDWDLVMRFNLHLDPLNFSFFGIFAKDSIGGRLTWWGLSHSASDRVEQLKFNNMNNGYNSSYGFADVRGVFQWFRLRADGTTMRYYTSSDGKMWMEWGSHPVTDFLANRPDQLGIGFCINRTGGATPLVGSIDHYSLTGPAV